MIDRSLDRLLTNTARDVTYPPTPQLGARVTAVAAAAPSRLQGGLLAPLGRGLEPALSLPKRRGATLRPALTIFIATTTLIVLAALAISPTRDAIARLFGVEGSRIEFLPTPLPGETATPFPTSAVGAPTPRAIDGIDLADVPRLAGFDPAVPQVDETWITSSLIFYGEQPVLQHHYASFDLWQSQLRQDAFFGKGVPEGGRVDEIDVGGVSGVWLTGAEHYVIYVDELGNGYETSYRVVTRNTLVWRTEAFFYRIETDLTLEEALHIAETLP